MKKVLVLIYNYESMRFVIFAANYKLKPNEQYVLNGSDFGNVVQKHLHSSAHTLVFGSSGNVYRPQV